MLLVGYAKDGLLLSQTGQSGGGLAVLDEQVKSSMQANQEKHENTKTHRPLVVKFGTRDSTKRENLE